MISFTDILKGNFLAEFSAISVGGMLGAIALAFVLSLFSVYIYRITFERKPDYGFSTAVSMFCSVIYAALMVTANTVSRRLGGGGLIGDVNNGH